MDFIPIRMVSMSVGEYVTFYLGRSAEKGKMKSRDLRGLVN